MDYKEHAMKISTLTAQAVVLDIKLLQLKPDSDRHKELMQQFSTAYKQLLDLLAVKINFKMPDGTIQSLAGFDSGTPYGKAGTFYEAKADGTYQIVEVHKGLTQQERAELATKYKAISASGDSTTTAFIIVQNAEPINKLK